MKKTTVKQSKYKNAGILFELLVRQITADTLSGRQSPAAALMKKYFSTSTELGKEMQLYRAFFEAGTLSEVKALHFIDLITEQRKKLDEKKLAREKYDLIRDIKENYDLKDFLSAKIPNYVVHASVYKTFVTETTSPEYGISNIRDVANARFTLIEHLCGKFRSPSKKSDEGTLALVEEFKSQTDDLRMLSYKILVDRFNEKYSGLNESQKTLLREYINNVSNSNTLAEHVRSTLPALKKSILSIASKTADRVMKIKLTEVATQLDTIASRKSVRDNDITALMIAYELVKEFENA